MCKKFEIFVFVRFIYTRGEKIRQLFRSFFSGNFLLTFSFLNLFRKISGHIRKGETLLHMASRGGKIELVKFFIEKGIDIYQTDENGYNALHWASF